MLKKTMCDYCITLTLGFTPRQAARSRKEVAAPDAPTLTTDHIKYILDKIMQQQVQDIDDFF